MAYTWTVEGIKSLGLMPSFLADVSKSRQQVQQGLTMPKVRPHPAISYSLGLNETAIACKSTPVPLKRDTV